MYRRILSLFITVMISIACIISLNSCSTNDNDNNKNDETNSNVKEIYMNEVGAWSNGVEFQIYNHKETSEIDSGLYKFKTNDKFLILGLRVYNGSSSTFTSSATDVWLLLGETKILQQDIVEKYAQGYDDISQSPTVTKEYFLFFEVGKDVAMSDLKLVINNGKLLSSESVIIKLKDAPKDSTVELDYAHDGKKETYHFYSGTSIVPSNFPQPSREGYAFSGWYFSEDCSGEPLTSLVLEKNQSLTLYAKWDAININIIYDGNGNSSGQMQNQVAQIGTSISVSENNYTKDGYYFVGWTTSVGSNEILAPNTTYNLSLSQNDLILYAKWAKNIYTIEDFNNINENSDCIFVLQNDLDFKGTNAITVSTFNGSFDGNYFTIKNSATPLFIENNGTIKNVVVTDCALSEFDNYIYKDYSVSREDITFDYAYGGLVSINRGTIENSLVHLSITKDFLTGSTSCFGGIAGINEGGSIVCSKSSLSITHNTIGENLYWGGIAGISSTSINEGNITNCYSSGMLNFPQQGERSTYLRVGGILGFGTNMTIRSSLSALEMDIVMNYAYKYIAGILGGPGWGGVTIDSCAMISNISCLDTGNGYVGGIACDTSYAYTIQNCYSNDAIKLMYHYSAPSRVQNGERISSDLFVTADFYLNNNVLESFIDTDTIEDNENAVWCIVDGSLPYLYWEK